MRLASARRAWEPGFDNLVRSAPRFCRPGNTGKVK